MLGSMLGSGDFKDVGDAEESLLSFAIRHHLNIGRHTI